MTIINHDVKGRWFKPPLENLIVGAINNPSESLLKDDCKEIRRMSDYMQLRDFQCSVSQFSL